MKAAVVLVLLAAACSKRDGASAASCKPLAVTVDGVPLAGLTHGLARGNRMQDGITYEVQLFDHGQVTCELLLDKAGRRVVPGEINVRAFAGGAGYTGKGVAIDAHTQMGGAVSLASEPPSAPGDVVKLCAGEVAFAPIAGAYKDKQVTISGLFEGRYCGELSW
jgi:hypothetical protein